ncbi:hypothetical protein D7D52_30055 [Nocardia yunnanensis]|uniref:ChsH2 rubredoxin-like zinc ribbon domain-containing protein n=1 Tax=Nocardia yunnanensis TaxID=2382165 RepID=A0A386ZL52_9NOCA|nr:zinc ribbon domain-containing protein [Nocardia yunnanensis]AYF77359.1 hypothetical protein D7D52_30055 [Nocardia yunnanensis]
MRVAVHPRLYDPSFDDPLLAGTECRECGRVYFPPMGLGCENCGAAADKLTETRFTATGVVFAVADVAVPAQGGPFTIAEIVLDAGPLIRISVHPDSATVRIGDRVTGHWHRSRRQEAGADLVEPMAVLVSGETA